MTIFSDLVRLHGYEHRLGDRNTFSMATIPYAPKYCWLSSELEAPAGFRCHYDMLKRFNDRLLQWNRINGLPALDMSSMGMKSPDDTTTSVQMPGWRVPEKPVADYRQWRENVPWRMLHLNDQNRIMMSLRVSAYFLNL